MHYTDRCFLSFDTVCSLIRYPSGGHLAACSLIVKAWPIFPKLSVLCAASLGHVIHKQWDLQSVSMLINFCVSNMVMFTFWFEFRVTNLWVKTSGLLKCFCFIQTMTFPLSSKKINSIWKCQLMLLGTKLSIFRFFKNSTWM